MTFLTAASDSLLSRLKDWNMAFFLKINTEWTGCSMQRKKLGKKKLHNKCRNQSWFESSVISAWIANENSRLVGSQRPACASTLPFFMNGSAGRLIPADPYD